MSSACLQIFNTISSIIKFTPLLGTNDDNALCYSLQLDEFFLLDCGLPELLDSQQTQIYLQELSKYMFYVLIQRE